MRKHIRLNLNPDERRGRRRQTSAVHTSDDNLSENSDPDNILFEVQNGIANANSKSGDTPRKQQGNNANASRESGGKISAKTRNSDGKSERDTGTINVNLHEAADILAETKSLCSGGRDLERRERVCCSSIRHVWNCCCGKCTFGDGVLKGKRLSVPRKQHIIHYWRKQLGRKIPLKKLAIVVDGVSDLKVSYQELDEFSNSIANNLKDMKFNDDFENLNPDGDLVIAVCLPSCYELIVLLVAILKLGATFLPLSSDFPPERIAEILVLTKPVLTIISSHEEENFKEVARIVEFDYITIDEIWARLSSSQESISKTFVTVKEIQSLDNKRPYPPMWKRIVGITVIPSEAEELQIVRYNSIAFLNALMFQKRYFPYLHSENCIMAPNSDSLDFVSELLTQLCIGVTIVSLPNPVDYNIPDILFMTCSVYNVKRLTVFPGLLKGIAISMQLFEGHSQSVASIRYWFCVGGLMTSEIAEMFFESAPYIARLIHMYKHDVCIGPLSYEVFETVRSATSKDYFARLPVGVAIPNTNIYVLDENRNIVPDGESGEIYIAGLQCPVVKPFSEEPPSEYYVQNPYSNNKDRRIMVRTFDYGRIVRKSNGVRILIHDLTRTRHCYVENRVLWLKHIDMYMKRLPNLVQEAYSLAYRANQDDQVILVFCIMVSNKITAKEVEDELCNCLPLSMIPEVVPVSEFPLLPDFETPDENELLNSYRKLKLKRQIYSGWDSLEIGQNHPHKLRAAKVLAYMILAFTGTPIKEIVEVHWTYPFLSLKRATITKGIFIVRELHRNRYPIYMDTFMYSQTLQNIVEEMVVARKERASPNPDCPPDEILFVKNRYKLALMVKSAKLGLCSLLARCFTARGQLDYYAQVDFRTMRKYFDNTWPIFADKKLSVVVRRKKERKEIVGGALSINWRDELSLKKGVPKSIGYKLELIEYLESGLTDTEFNQENAEVLQICYIGLDGGRLTNAEIHGITDKIIRSMLIISKVKQFDAVVLISYDYFTWDICVHNYKFNVGRECQVNQFVSSDGTRPYTLAPDTLIASMLWKTLNKVKDIPKHERPVQLPKILKVADDAKVANQQKKPWSS